jgi:hypothetical protein
LLECSNVERLAKREEKTPDSAAAMGQY